METDVMFVALFSLFSIFGFYTQLLLTFFFINSSSLSLSVSPFLGLWAAMTKSYEFNWQKHLPEFMQEGASFDRFDEVKILNFLDD